MNETKIFAISLDRFSKRFENLSRNLEKIGLECEFFQAVDGRENKKHSLFNRHDKKKRMLIKGNLLRGPELGCYSSHYLLWEKCVSLNEPIIVLEDDAIIIPDNFSDFYNNIKNLKTDYECIRLFYCEKRKPKFLKIETFGAFDIVKFFKGPSHTVGYYLTPSGAKKFLESSKTWILPVDIFMDRFWTNKVECYGVTPICLEHGVEIYGSNITDNTRVIKKNFLTRVRRETFAAKELFFRLVHNLKYWLKFIIINRK